MKKEKNFNLILTMSFLVITFIIGIAGISYAYYRYQVEPTNISSMFIGTTDLNLQYTESLNIVGENIAPGWTDTKTFTITNNGNLPTNYKISWTDVTNSFVNKGYLTYAISSTNNGCNVIKSTFPSGTEQICTASINAGESQVYTLVMTYNDSDTYNLASDMGTAFAGTITVEGASINDTYTVAVAATNATITGGTTVENILPDGNYESGTTGYSLALGVTRSNVNKKFGSWSIRNLGGKQYSAARLNWGQVNLNGTNKYYTSGWTYTNTKGNGVMYIDFSFAYSGTNHWTGATIHRNLNKWEKLSKITCLNDSSITPITLSLALVHYNGTDQMQDGYVDGAMVIDLTATGWQLKTKAWLDKNVPFFEGTGSIKSNTVTANGTTTFTLTPATGKTYNELVCDGGYRTAVVNNNILTVTGVSSDIQCSVFYR